jgi:hypothetical protein
MQVMKEDKPLRLPHRRTTTQAGKHAFAAQCHLSRGVPETFLKKTGILSKLLSNT